MLYKYECYDQKNNEIFFEFEDNWRYEKEEQIFVPDKDNEDKTNQYWIVKITHNITDVKNPKVRLLCSFKKTV